MSLLVPDFTESVVVRHAAAEVIGQQPTTAQLLSGDQVVTAEHGDLVVVPPGLPHAFAAAPGHDADILIVITPGVERFEYFRHLERIAYGKVAPESLLEVQELYDTYFRASPTWDAARPGPPREP
jgi:hypothetical protein